MVTFIFHYSEHILPLLFYAGPDCLAVLTQALTDLFSQANGDLSGPAGGLATVRRRLPVLIILAM